MCKKLSVLLVLVAMSTPAMAAYINLTNPLHVDIDGGGVTTPHGTWQQWLFASNWTGPAQQQFANPNGGASQKPIGQLEVMETPKSPQTAGGSRNRDGGMAFVPGTGDFGITSQGYGMNYIKLTLTQLAPSTEYCVYLWSFEKASVWSMASTNPDSKFVAWSTQNPKSWLADNYSGKVGEPPNGGYGPKVGTDHPDATTDSNMPKGLADTVQKLARADMSSSQLDNSWDMLGSDTGKAKIRITTNDEGSVEVYGWLDATDWSGSAHVPLAGFAVMPEPATMVLLGLGGLALIRRKRA